MTQISWDRERGVLRTAGPPVTPEMQMLFGGYGAGKVTGIVTLPTGIQVEYDSGIVLTFAPFHAGAKVTASQCGLAGATIIGGGIPSA